MSVPGVRIVDPESGRAWAVHADWPKCRLASAASKAAHNARTSDPAVLAGIAPPEHGPADCGCEHCAQAEAMGEVAARWGRDAPYHWDEAADALAAWLRAHRHAQDHWPAAHWQRLYPMTRPELLA